MWSRSIADQLRYKRHQKSHPSGCGFCTAIEKGTEQVVETYGTMTLLRNRFPYARWDGRRVADHLMIVPARHITAIGQFSKQESTDFLSVMGDFESRGYSFYIRSDANRSKSMAHLHGHLILAK